VLSDIDAFGMPLSAAQRLALPQKLVNLNFGLFSMRGQQHAQHQRLLMRVLNARSIEDQHGPVAAGLETFAQGWQPGTEIALLSEMRRLALQVSSRLLFGDLDGESYQLGSLIQAYFQLRREAASPFASAAQTSLQELIALGTALDHALRQRVRCYRELADPTSGGILARLAGLELETGRPLSEDELVAHGNVLFMSSSEPIAVVLTWTFLILSQLPEVRCALRRELESVSLVGDAPPAPQLAQLTLLDAVVSESLRLLPPNALMVRLTTRPTALYDLLLPERCELVMCPFLAHRDPERFPRPNAFLPSRWCSASPSPFEYLPFGAGGRYCMGRHLAIYMIKAALAFLLRRYDLVLARHQEIDWRIHVNLMPTQEPIMTIRVPHASAAQKGGELLGAITDLVSLDA
jgi:cytochrome P450